MERITKLFTLYTKIIITSLSCCYEILCLKIWLYNAEGVSYIMICQTNTYLHLRVIFMTYEILPSK